MSELLEFFVTAPRGTADLLLAELVDFGALEARERIGGVACRGGLELAYRALWWSRVANRVLLVLARFPAADGDALYAGVRTVEWAAQLDVEGTLAVDAVTNRSALTHSHFVAQRTKDAVVDALRAPDGRRPAVDTAHPDLRLNVYLDRDEAQLALDLAGASLHRRGYRASQGAAPLKENLAAALLLRAGWPALAAAGKPLVDPMCGAATLPIEAALIAGDVAPGLLRGDVACTRWRGHDAALWQRLASEAAARRDAGRARLPAIVGYDADATAIEHAWENIERAGLRGLVHVERREIGDAAPPSADAQGGLVICNPPYGERLQARSRPLEAWMSDPRRRAPARIGGQHENEAAARRAELAALYRRLGQVLRTRFAGWDAAVLTGDPALGLELGIKARRTHTVWNGALECRLLRLRVTPEFLAPDVPPGSERIVRARQRVAKRETPSAGGAMFANRLRKNLQSIGRWARRAQVSCFRLYDADMPEYALAIDVYTARGDGGEARWLHVQEYAAPATIDEERARARLDEALALLPEVLEVPVERIVFKRRERQRGTAQYERLASEGNFLEVVEGGLRFLVNLRDYLDTGLFLDHRATRALLREKSRDRDVLNLFSYTGTASVYAAAGGARSTTSVDLSATYLRWAERNLALNGFGAPAHQVLQADCVATLAAPPTRRYGLIFLDPPSFSNSKRMRDTLDVQRDHVTLIRQCLARLTPDGELVFSTNLRRFKLDRVALAGLPIEDLSRDTLPADFARNARIHQCFVIRRG
ncbi:MAG TPA: bifunctional 23S rRNA (guanine(2069)-N(7))-methyltransferase RlmK/23S rRNA (guanine(2445)-N(2))-methyltransferase RlmL [Gammaproteobacteria bacterium]|nr:bifunctional 23S rRNA (guanine(2069)-N(7))-methyltransferase RlmK/23S rRNA (guanine(2445)-N(2))-methyltransferase RlmL [Gammaproteobacteria bacterium]